MPYRKKTPWTDELIAQVTKAWSLGQESASKIAARLGLTKNQVISKMHRVHKADRPRPVRPAPIRRDAAPRKRTRKATNVFPFPTSTSSARPGSIRSAATTSTSSTGERTLSYCPVHVAVSAFGSGPPTCGRPLDAGPEVAHVAAAEPELLDQGDRSLRSTRAEGAAEVDAEQASIASGPDG